MQYDASGESKSTTNLVLFIAVATLLIIASIIIFETPSKNQRVDVICSNCSYEIRDKPSYTDKLIDPVSIFTLFLVISTVALWRSTQTLADSAKESADTVQVLERGYLFLNDPIDGNIGNALIYPANSPMMLSMDIAFKNHGRTPVTIRGLDQVYSYFRDLNELYTCFIPGQMLPNGIVVGANSVSQNFQCGLGFTVNQLISARNGSGFIAYMVTIEYNDIFGKKCVTSACRVYDGSSSFYVWGDERLNYHKNE